MVFLNRSPNQHKNGSWFHLDVHAPPRFSVTPEDIVYVNLGKFSWSFLAIISYICISARYRIKLFATVLRISPDKCVYLFHMWAFESTLQAFPWPGTADVIYVFGFQDFDATQINHHFQLHCQLILCAYATTIQIYTHTQTQLNIIRFFINSICCFLRGIYSMRISHITIWQFYCYVYSFRPNIQLIIWLWSQKKSESFRPIPTRKFGVHLDCIWIVRVK